ncbi:MAG: hypothetical protein ACLR1T_11880 [Evtepia gabavorous]
MRKRILSVVLTVLMLAAMVPSAMAATLEEINQDEVFLKQQQRGTCTLASTAMMLRRAAMLNGDENWAQITEASCREAFWLSGRGLPYNFSYGEMTVGHDRLPGGQANEAVLIDLLEEHPEGSCSTPPAFPTAFCSLSTRMDSFTVPTLRSMPRPGSSPLRRPGAPGWRTPTPIGM